MKKLIAIIAVCFSIPVWSQHCGFDFTTIMLIHITDQDNVLIPDLKVTLLDAQTEKPVMVSFPGKNGPPEEFMIRQLNPGDELYSIGDDHRLYPSNAELYFGISYAFQIISTEGGKFADQFKIKIEDVDDNLNGGHFKTTTVQLSNNDCYCMCTHFDAGRIKPFVVKLELN